MATVLQALQDGYLVLQVFDFACGSLAYVVDGLVHGVAGHNPNHPVVALDALERFHKRSLGWFLLHVTSYKNQTPSPPGRHRPKC
jgi:hypothetical protein